MHQFTEPRQPQNFDEKVAAERERVEAWFGRRGRRRSSKAGKHGEKRAKRPDPFPDLWTQFKAHLSRAQFRKCAFCEGWAIGQEHGDVEHYRPKGEVEELDADPETWGSEAPHLANVSGRKPKQLSVTGYWWLAYQWENYVLSCNICNRQWKRAIFPVAEVPRALPPRPDIEETPLLLHPFRGPAPREHLEFGRGGEVYPRDGSLYGHET